MGVRQSLQTVMDLMGSYGSAHEYHVEKYMRDVKQAELWLGGRFRTQMDVDARLLRLRVGWSQVGADPRLGTRARGVIGRGWSTNVGGSGARRGDLARYGLSIDRHREGPRCGSLYV